jgi:hypothetical protein
MVKLIRRLVPSKTLLFGHDVGVLVFIFAILHMATRFARTIPIKFWMENIPVGIERRLAYLLLTS